MNSDFSRLLTLQRKEHKISQKQAAADLGVSQALLSHYEKGIRECGLDFLVRAAEYYNVSCDYLLGRTESKCESKSFADSVSNIDNEKLITEKSIITNSASHLIDIALKSDSPALAKTISSYLMVTIYKLFRIVCKNGTYNKNQDFEISEMVSSELADSVLSINEASLKCAALHPYNNEPHDITGEQSASMLHVIRYSENTIKQKLNSQ